MKKNIFVTALLLTLGFASAQYVTPHASRPDVVTFDVGASNFSADSSSMKFGDTTAYGNITVTEALYTGKNGQILGELKAGSEAWNNYGFVEGGLSYNTSYNNTDYSVYANVRRNVVTECGNTSGCRFDDFGTGVKVGVKVNLR